MTAYDNLSEPLFHGSGQTIPIGSVVRPNQGMFGIGAYATTKPERAARYADDWFMRPGWKGQGTLFGTVYKVEPVSEDGPEKVDENQEEKWFKDPKGMRVTGVHKHVIPLEQEVLWHAQQERKENGEQK